MPAPPVLVAGTLAFDTVARAASLPGDDEAARVTHRHERGGGAGANVAHAVARLGHGAPLVTAYGPDLPGSGYESDLEEVGVDLGPAVEADEPTARAWIFSGPGDHQRIYYDPGATPAMEGCRIPGGTWSGWGHFAAGAIDAYPPLMEAVEHVAFDPGQEVFHRPVGDVEACLPHVDVLLLNEHERDRLSDDLGRGPGDLVRGGIEAVVVTRGGDPVRVHHGGSVEEVPVPEAEVRDPTGAGDAHRAGTVAGLARGLDRLEAVRLGNVVAAATVEEMGTQDGHPGPAEARARYEETYGAPPW